jgi:hypothetical protein
VHPPVPSDFTLTALVANGVHYPSQLQLSPGIFLIPGTIKRARISLIIRGGRSLNFHLCGKRLKL